MSDEPAKLFFFFIASSLARRFMFFSLFLEKGPFLEKKNFFVCKIDGYCDHNVYSCFSDHFSLLVEFSMNIPNLTAASHMGQQVSILLRSLILPPQILPTNPYPKKFI
jgi:hypothetical protein